MRKLASVKVVALVLGGVALVLVSMFAGSRLALTGRAEREPGEPQAGAASNKPAPSAADLDLLLAPVALYPDPLLAQMLLSASDPPKVKELNTWLKSNQNLKGTAAAGRGGEGRLRAELRGTGAVSADREHDGRTASDWTTQLGQAFAADRSAVFASIQRLRTQAQAAGNSEDHCLSRKSRRRPRRVASRSSSSSRRIPRSSTCRNTTRKPSTPRGRSSSRRQQQRRGCRRA